MDKPIDKLEKMPEFQAARAAVLELEAAENELLEAHTALRAAVAAHVAASPQGVSVSTSPDGGDELPDPPRDAVEYAAARLVRARVRLSTARTNEKSTSNALDAAVERADLADVPET